MASFDARKRKGARRACNICGLREAHAPDKMFFANFPLDENRCREWVRVTGNEELAHLPIAKLNTAKYVCSLHFKPKDFAKSGKRLKKRAIPCLNVAPSALTNDQMADFPLQMSSIHVNLSSTSNEPAASDPNIMQNLPSTSSGIAASGPIVVQNLPLTCSGTAASSLNIIQNAQDFVHVNLPSTSRADQSGIRRAAVTVEKESKGVKQKLTENEGLSPKKRKLVETLAKTKCTLKSLKKSAILLDKIESPALKELIVNSCKNEKRKPKGRRWTLKHKLSCLAILKRSAKTYRHLSAAVPLPSVKTLQNILKKIPLQPGINEATVKHLKSIAKDKNEKEKTCCLVFDEMAIKLRLLYNESSDKVEGFEDLGEHGRKNNLADHALVFLLQGLYKKFKQPIAFYLTKGTISSSQLSVIIKTIIKKVTECGFTVVNTVCDQGPTNMGALKILKDYSGPLEDGANHYFIVDGKKIFIMYDIPHLFKSIRNNFMNSGNLIFNSCKAKWQHLVEMENENRNFLYLSKITPTHVNPKYRGKMKVKLATQLLSNTTGAVLTLMARAEREPKAAELKETANVIRELDKLFDTSNGPAGPKDKKKGIRTNVSKESNHMDNWAEFIKKFEKTKFVNKYGQPSKNVKCIEGYIISLKSLRDIWKTVQALDFKYLNLRNLNQDALENLFGVIRQHSPTNRNPTAAHFIAALKTSIVTGLTAVHSRGANCEKDNKYLLTNFQNFVMQEEDNDENNKENIDHIHQEETKERIASMPEEGIIESDFILNIPEQEITESDFTLLSEQPVVYVAGYLAKQILKIIKCDVCKKHLTVCNPEDNHMYSYIMLREWWENKFALTYPSTGLCEFVKTLKDITEKEIVPRLHECNISVLGCTLFSVHAPSIKLYCNVHKHVTNLLYEKTCKLFIRRQCQIVNQSLQSKEEELSNINKKAEQLGKAK